MQHLIKEKQYYLKKSRLKCKVDLLKHVYISDKNMMEKGQLLEIHLLEKTARHQNLDCSTLFEQMSKKWKLLENEKSVILSRCKF